MRRSEDYNWGEEIEEGGSDDWEIFYVGASHKRLQEILLELKESADRSGNAQVWRRGEPLDHLNPGLRERVRRAIEYGI